MRDGGPRVTAKLALLVASMRAGGARLGVGDLLTAHRALAAVDAASRTDSYLALRAALCARHADFEVFDAAFEAVFGLAVGSRQLADASDTARLVLPRVAVPPQAGQQGAEQPPPDEPPVPAAWSEVELLR